MSLRRGTLSSDTFAGDLYSEIPRLSLFGSPQKPWQVVVVERIQSNWRIWLGFIIFLNLFMLEDFYLIVWLLLAFLVNPHPGLLFISPMAHLNFGLICHMCHPSVTVHATGVVVPWIDCRLGVSPGDHSLSVHCQIFSLVPDSPYFLKSWTFVQNCETWNGSISMAFWT